MSPAQGREPPTGRTAARAGRPGETGGPAEGASGFALCLGAAHWDLVGRPGPAHAGRLAPGDDVPGSVVRRPGGVALNIACALARTGRRVALAAPAGGDSDGVALAEALRASGVALRPLPVGRPTGRYLAIETASGELFAAIADLPGCEAVTAEGALAALDPEAAVWVVEANLPAPVLAAIAHAPRRALLAANPASPAKAARLRPLLDRIDLLGCNRAEAEALAGRPLPDAAAAVRALLALGAREAVVTDGPRPAAAADASGLATLAPAPAGAPLRRRAVTGAGDALFAAHLHARLSGAPPAEALAAGLAAARAVIEEEPT